MKVRATNPGIYGKYRKEGEEFEIVHDQHFSDRWMEMVKPEKRTKKKKRDTIAKQFFDGGGKSSPLSGAG
jgi:hypothetical protein